MIESILPLLLKASLITLEASALGTVFGLAAGILMGVFNSDRLKRPGFSQLINLYVAIIRGTPIFVQLLIVYFAVPEMLQIDIPPLAAGVIALSFNSAAYLSEIIRGSINAISPGQWEAADTLGYSRFQSLRYIILPQAIKNAVPSITNEFSNLIKESSILLFIGVPELMKASRDIVARELRPMEVYAVTALIYFAMTSVVAMLTKQLERRI
jgi:His/Glu/Gln/Arg/opine family amino acid ABC transporter permease subunit